MRMIVSSALIASALCCAAAAAEPNPNDIAAALMPHLNAHGEEFVATEAERLEMGAASLSSAPDDARDACPQPASCFDFAKMSPEELTAAMTLLAAQREQTLLEKRIGEIKGRNEELKRLQSDLQKETDKDRLADLRSQIDTLNAGSQMDMIELQDLVNKRNQAMEMVSNLLQKHQKTLDRIIGNMR